MNPIKFKRATQIVMADNHNVDTVLTDSFFQLIKEDGQYLLLDGNGDTLESFNCKRDGVDDLMLYVINDDTPVTGYSTHSGRKYWQLPIQLQNQVKRAIRIK